MYAHREKNVDKNRITCESHAFYSYRFLAKKKNLNCYQYFLIHSPQITTQNESRN